MLLLRAPLLVASDAVPQCFEPQTPALRSAVKSKAVLRLAEVHDEQRHRRTGHGAATGNGAGSRRPREHVAAVCMDQHLPGELAPSLPARSHQQRGWPPSEETQSGTRQYAERGLVGSLPLRSRPPNAHAEARIDAEGPSLVQPMSGARWPAGPLQRKHTSVQCCPVPHRHSQRAHRLETQCSSPQYSIARHGGHGTR